MQKTKVKEHLEHTELSGKEPVEAPQTLWSHMGSAPGGLEPPISEGLEGGTTLEIAVPALLVVYSFISSVNAILGTCLTASLDLFIRVSAASLDLSSPELYCAGIGHPDLINTDQ